MNFSRLYILICYNPDGFYQWFVMWFPALLGMNYAEMPFFLLFLDFRIFGRSSVKLK